jgi:hypothetical protein
VSTDTLLLEHSMPGRARLRLPKPRTPDEVLSAADRLRSAPSVQAVEATPVSGSLYVRWDPDSPLDLVLEDIRGLGYVVDVAAHWADAMGPADSDGAKVIKVAFRGANRRLHAATEGKMDLRVAVPALFAALAARQFIRDAGRIKNASWYQLAYWAFDSFDKLNRDAHQPRS